MKNNYINTATKNEVVIMNTENLHKVLVRMDKDLHERIKTLAEIEHRSVNSQINIMLEKSLKKEG